MASRDPATVTALPTPESLLLSAALFTSSVSSWIPANFGHVVPAAEAEKEWQSLLRAAGEGKDRLGLGHPLINAPKAAGGGYKGGLKGLEKSMKDGKRRAGEEERERGDQPEANTEEKDEDEEESRASRVRKRKRMAVFDPLGGKRKKGGGVKGVSTPTPTASAGTSTRTSPVPSETIIVSTNIAPVDEQTGTTSVDVETTPTPLSKSPSRPLPEAHTSSLDNTQSTSIPTSPTKSKSAIKREKKKRAKLAKLALEQQP